MALRTQEDLGREIESSQPSPSPSPLKNARVAPPARSSEQSFVDHGRQPTRDFPLPWLVAAAALVLSGSGAFWWSTHRTGPVQPILAERSTAGDLRTARLELSPKQRSVLAQPPLRFTWPHQAGATSHTVRLFTSSAEPLWQSATTADTTIKIEPNSVPGTLQPGSYLWEVQVDGRVAREILGPYWFEVLPKD